MWRLDGRWAGRFTAIICGPSCGRASQWPSQSLKWSTRLCQRVHHGRNIEPKAYSSDMHQLVVVCICFSGNRQPWSLPQLDDEVCTPIPRRPRFGVCCPWREGRMRKCTHDGLCMSSHFAVMCGTEVLPGTCDWGLHWAVHERAIPGEYRNLLLSS